MAWVEMPAPALAAAAEAGVLFYRMAPEVARLVTSWQTTPDDVLEASAIFRDAVTALAQTSSASRAKRSMRHLAVSAIWLNV